MRKLLNAIRVYADYELGRYNEAVKTAIRFMVGFHQPLTNENFKKFEDFLNDLNPKVMDVFYAMSMLNYISGKLTLDQMRVMQIDVAAKKLLQILKMPNLKLPMSVLKLHETYIKHLEATAHGTYVNLDTRTCLFCRGTGYAIKEHDVTCPVCNGNGTVLYPKLFAIEWENFMDGIPNDTEILKFYDALINDYINHFVLEGLYHEFGCSNNRINDRYHMYFDTFTAPLKCSFTVSGEIQQNPFNVTFKVDGVSHTMKVIDMRNATIAEKIDEVKNSTNAAIKETLHTGNCNYVTKKGLRIVGVPIKKANVKGMKKYYRARYKYLDVIYNAELYTRDQVRQAFSNCAGVDKSLISVKTYFN